MNQRLEGLLTLPAGAVITVSVWPAQLQRRWPVTSMACTVQRAGRVRQGRPTSSAASGPVVSCVCAGFLALLFGMIVRIHRSGVTIPRMVQNGAIAMVGACGGCLCKQSQVVSADTTAKLSDDCRARQVELGGPGQP